MKKFMMTALLLAFAFAPTVEYRQAGAEELAECKAAYLCDFESGTVAYQKNETERLPIASMCKIMTLLLSFEAVDGGLSTEELVSVSENASGMGGSQVFLGNNLSYPLGELIKSVAVCSANDSCVALAERIAGSEELFVEKMNDRAKELGAENTLFANCTGLPKEPQYSCAKDVSLMLRELLKHKQYYEYSKVWLEDFHHPDGRTTTMTNTNKLIRFFEGCDGGKTGFTNQAGFCLAATATRGDMRLVSVVIGAESSDKRFTGTKNLLNYGFSAYECEKIAEAGKPAEIKCAVQGSRQKEIGVCAEKSLTVFHKRGETPDAKVEFLLRTIKAPVKTGDAVGEAVLYRSGVEVDRCRLLAAEDADRLSWWDACRDSARNWN